jgi:hypothetical protein
MSAGNKIIHDKCGTPDCCMNCDTSLFEEVPTMVSGSIPSLTNPTDAYALQKDRIKKRIAAKVASKILRRKKPL